MKHVLPGLLFATLALCLCPLFSGGAMAAQTYQVGFRTLGHWDGETGIRLDINIWYPTIRREKEIQYSPWTLYGARNGKAVEGQFPLLLVSHPSPGTRFSLHDTCYWLAAHGFVVAAPTHTRDCMDDMRLLFSWEQLSTRARELSTTISVLAEDRDIAPSIDSTRIGLVGYGAGGAAALLLGGALPTCDGWVGYCDEISGPDTYCNSWTREKMQKLCTQLPLKKSLADTRIKAIAVAQPGYGMLFSPDAMRHFYPPLLILAADRDTLHVYTRHAEAIARRMDGKAHYVRLKGADMGAMMASCPESLSDELPELCRSVSSKERAAIHGNMQDALGDFFLKYLGNTENLPIIPPPPDLTPAPAAPNKNVTPATGKNRTAPRKKARPSGGNREQ